MVTGLPFEIEGWEIPSNSTFARWGYIAAQVVCAIAGGVILAVLKGWM